MKRRWTLSAACLVGVLLVAGMGLGARSLARASVYVVSIDGHRIGTVKDPAEVTRSVEAILTEARNVWPADIEVMSKVDCVPAKREDNGANGAEPLTPEALTEVLQKTLQFSATAYVIQVEGKDVVALRDRSAAEFTMEEVSQAYAGEASRKGTSSKVEQARVLQQVEIVEKRVPAETLKEPDEAKQILLRGTDRVQLHVVQKGDSLWTIANANGMTVEQVRKANPQLAGDRLKIGQTLNLIVPEPYVNVVTVETVTQEIAIPFEVDVEYDDSKWPWEQAITRRGVAGCKQVVLEISRKDGREVARRIVSENLLSEPQTQYMVQGSKLIPNLGTGSFAWPAQGSITSRYGSRRGGFHHGLDIAAPVGTPVMAADSGMVAFAGRLPYYGNVVRLDHGEGKAVTVYGHLSKILVKQGEVVKRGQVIGNVGNTGRSTGPHLHFEIRLNGSPTDPLKMYPPSGS
ncbi:MAG: peptidoglycan DD-metalloendopeptidase family protein [Firmicutes bacterium]|nr:peptidoglycan DD-metalloendopeptidase family protein [Bacillota bacterium]